MTTGSCSIKTSETSFDTIFLFVQFVFDEIMSLPDRETELTFMRFIERALLLSGLIFL